MEQGERAQQAQVRSPASSHKRVFFRLCFSGQVTFGRESSTKDHGKTIIKSSKTLTYKAKREYGDLLLVLNGLGMEGTAFGYNSLVLLFSSFVSRKLYL